MSAHRTYPVVVLCLVLGLCVGQAWGQNISLFPKEEILLVGGDFRIRSVNSNIAGADQLGGEKAAVFPPKTVPPSPFLIHAYACIGISAQAISCGCITVWKSVMCALVAARKMAVM